MYETPALFDDVVVMFTIVLVQPVPVVTSPFSNSVGSQPTLFPLEEPQ